MRDVVWPAERGNHDCGNAESEAREVPVGVKWGSSMRKVRVRTSWIRSTNTNVHRFNAIRAGYIRRRGHVIVQTAALVEGEDEDRVLPR